MTVTKPYLSGTDEPFAETIRYLLSTKWDAANTSDITPAFLSPNGINKETADASKNNYGLDWTALVNKTDLVRVNNGETEPLVESRYVTEFMTTVYIDIFSRNTFALEQFKNEVNRIIFEYQPNTTTRLSASGTQLFNRDTTKEFNTDTLDTRAMAKDATGFLFMQADSAIHKYSFAGVRQAGELRLAEHEQPYALAVDPTESIQTGWEYYVGEQDQISIFDSTLALRETLDSVLIDLDEQVIGMDFADGKLWYITSSGKISQIVRLVNTYNEEDFMQLDDFTHFDGALAVDIEHDRIYIAVPSDALIKVVRISTRERLTDEDIDLDITNITGMVLHDNILYIANTTNNLVKAFRIESHTSPITGFRQNAIGWVNPQDVYETGGAVMAAGELDCKWQLHLTT